VDLNFDKFWKNTREISPKDWKALIWNLDMTDQNIKGPVVVGQFFLAVALQYSLYFVPFSGNGCTENLEYQEMKKYSCA